jgi:hypothetical protein
MPPNTEGAVVSDRKLVSQSFYTKIGLTFVGLCFVIGAVYTGYLYYALPAITEDMAIESSDRFFADTIAGLPPFTFSVVPDALATLSIPKPSTESLADLKTELASAATLLRSSEENDIEVIYDMPVGDVTLLEYLNELPSELQYPMIQMQDELTAIVSKLNSEYPQVTLAARVRGGEDVGEIPGSLDGAGKVSVYPSIRVVEAYYFTDVLSRQFPGQKSRFDEYVTNFVQQGTSRGHYSEADAAVARLLVEDYMKAAEKSEIAQPVLGSFEQ